MTYLEKPRWIDREDQDRPFPRVLSPVREELNHEKPVQFSGPDEDREFAVDLLHSTDDSDTIEDRVMIAAPDLLLDEPERGTKKNQPDMKKQKGTVQITLDQDP